VVDDHITGVLSEHQAGKCLDIPPTGIRVRGRNQSWNSTNYWVDIVFTPTQ
jgi:hypothetical protein